MGTRPEAGDSAELVVGVVTGPHGVRGAVRVRVYAGHEQVLVRDGWVRLVGPGGRAVRITEVHPVPGKSLVRLSIEGVCTREQADALRGHELRVDRAKLPPLGADEFYLADVIGLSVVGSVGGGPERALGTVTGLTSNGAQDLLEVTDPLHGVWLLPALPGFICAVAEVVRVDLPEGMGPEDAR